MKLEKSADINENYSARIVRVKDIQKHPNADRLALAEIQNRTIIVGNTVKVGDIGVFCPIESELSKVFLSTFSLFKDKERNSNKEKSGFFADSGRVKCTKLRGIISEGYWFELATLSEFANCSIDELERLENTSFNILNGEVFIKKYTSTQEYKNFIAKAKKNAVKEDSRLVENQFRFHSSTSQLADNLHKIKEESLLYITSKLHGTSFVCANVLTKKKLTFSERVANFFGASVVKTVYDILVSSRTVIKNQYSTGFYKEDVWTVWKDKIAHKLEKGITVYGEIVGQQSNGGWIQKGYTYGLPANTSELYIYRITSTNVDGVVTELSWDAVKDYCTEHNLNTVPQYECILVKSLLYFDNSLDSVVQALLARLKATYLEKMLAEGVPDEGICLRVEEGRSLHIYKLKSKLFYEFETKTLDTNEVNLEDEA